jgi:bacterioferritin-associated ferredoxin
MYVCVCKAVTEGHIHQAAQDGARTLKDLRRELGVTSECGRCAGCARNCLREARHAAPADGLQLAAA